MAMIAHDLVTQGFGESPYLQRLLRETYAEKDVQILTSDEPAKKAVAEGESFPSFPLDSALVVDRPVSQAPPSST